MRMSYTGAGAPKIEIDRHEMHDTPPTGTNAGRVRRIGSERITFGDLARFVCPTKTSAWLAHIAECDVRTAERWLSERNEPPAEVLGKIMFEIMRRYSQRGE